MTRTLHIAARRGLAAGRRRLITAVVLPVCALLGLVIVPPSEAAAPGQLVLRGAGTAAIDLELKKTSSIDLRAFVPDSRATFSGVVLRDSRGRFLGSAIQVQRWTTVPKAPAPIVTLSGPLSLTAGRYRVELLASGPATVRVPSTGDLVRTLTLTRPAPSRVTLTDLGASGVPVSNQRYPGVRVTPTGASLLVFFKRTTAHQASLPQLCFVEPAAPTCAQAYGFSTVFASPGSVGEGWVQSFTALYGGDALDGVYDALVQNVTVDVPAGTDALLVQL
jgi:hypothetical protein